MIIRLMLHLITLLLIKLPLQIIGIVILLPVFFIFNPDGKRLPKALKWFGIWEKKGYGIDGDFAWQLAHSDPTKPWPRYKYNALRNAVNHFQWEVLGKENKPTIYFHVEGTTHTTSMPGRYYAQAIDATDQSLYAWEYYYHEKVLGVFPIRLRIGYKIGNMEDWERNRFQWAFSISPFKQLGS